MQRCASWIACCAILLAALAPSISHALASHDAHHAWVEICTEQGSKLISVADSLQPASPSQTQHVDHFEHCPFCKSGSTAAGVLPTSDFVLPLLAGTPVLPALFYQASHPLFAWAVAQPRAPPALS